MAGINLPQLAPASEDRVSGAQVIDGSLTFEKAKKKYLTKTPGSSGNQKTWTLSLWFRKQNMGDQRILCNSFTDNSNRVIIRFMSDKLQFALQTGGTFYGLQTNQVFRDNGWYHVVLALDTTQSREIDRQKIYVNGAQIADADLTHNSISGSNKYPAEDATFNFNTNVAHYIGANNESSSIQDTTFDGQITNVYIVDGQSLGPGYFGFTDPLTGTWRPKKFRAEGTTVNDGRVFSSTGTFSNWDDDGSYPKTELFDGTLYTGGTPNGACPDDGNPATFDFGDRRITGFENLQVNIFLSSNQSSATNVVSVNGIDITQECHAAGNNTWTMVDLGSKFKTLQSFSVANNNIYVGGFIIDGVIMQNSTTQNLDFGTNGVYLPMDGNTPIGQDHSGKGNDWTPLNFDGSNTIEKSTGAKPILNTTPGGTLPSVGVFGSEVSAHYTTTSATNSGGKYVFENEGTQPTLSFVRGATYTFDYSASTGHPLRFATAADAAGSTQYTDGTSVSGNVISFTVPHNAPNTLYYYCTNHGNMGNSISVTTDETKADPYAWKNVLAMPLVGGSGVDYSSQINATTSAKTVTVTSATSSSLGNFYNASMNFDGSNDKLDVADSTDFDVDTGDWCAECWFYTPSSDSTSQSIFRNYSADNSQFMLGINSLQLFGYLGNTQIINAGTDTAISAGEWVHLALTHDDSVGATGLTTLYIDGIARATNSSTSVPSANHNGFFLGHNTTHGSRWITGNYQDVRFYKGTKKYTGNFIPASTSPDILPDSPSGVAAKPKLTKPADGAVSFDGTGDVLSVPDHADLRFGTGAFTIECYVWFNSITTSTYPSIFSKYTGDTASWIMRIKNDGKAVFYSAVGGGTNNESSTTPIVVKKWHHIAMVREGTGSNQAKMYVDGQLVVTATDGTDYTDTQVIAIGAQNTSGNNALDGYMSNCRIIKGTALYTSNFTPPTRALTNVTNTKLLCCQSNSSAGIAAVSPDIGGINDGRVWSDSSDLASPGLLFDGDDDTYVNSSTTSGGNLITAATQFTVPEGQTLTIRTQNGGSSNISVNGSNVSVNSGNVVTTLVTGGVGGTVVTSITAPTGYNLYYLKLNGVSLMDPVAPIADATATNFNPFNTDIDTVRGQEGVYATLNPLLNSKFQSKTLKDGNLEFSGSNAESSGYPTAFSNFTMNGSGKWYMEAIPFNMTDTGGVYIGLCDDQMISNATTVANTYPGGPGGVAYCANGTIADNNSNTFTSQPTYTVGDVISVAYDADNGKVYFAKNGNYIAGANPVTGANPHDTGRTGDQFFVVGVYGARNIRVNFGQKPFKFPPPDGYQPLTSSTLRPDTVITHPEQYFAVNLYKGNGATSVSGSGGTQTIDVGHKADLIWIKDLTHASHDHNLIDTIRGAGSILMSNATTAPPITNSTDAVTAFTDTGFTLGDNGEGTQSLELNKGGNNYVVWSWVAGGTPTATNDNTSGAMDANSVSVDGVLQSAYTPVGSPTIYPKKMSVGTKQGFSIVEYGGNSTSGAKVPHGLTQAPDFMVIKTTTLNGQGWGAYHQGIGATKYLQLNTTDHQSNDYAGFLNNTAPTNQVFTLGNDNFVNTGNTYMAYCWHDVPGLQKFGTYIGNGQNDNFVELGFRPAMVWVKRAIANSSPDTSTNYSSWVIMDSSRLTYNGQTPNHLYVNKYVPPGYRGNGSNTSDLGDMLLEPHSNGFYLNNHGSEVNSTTGKYIYCAWAEAPTFNLYGATATAR